MRLFQLSTLENMHSGTVFDIREFSINDGPGIRTTVFLKGCPLRCAWCHNPEGISPFPQYNESSKRTVGEEWTSQKVIEKIIKSKDVFDMSGGGVTFSGGEPTFQADFLSEILDGLADIHTLLDTSGLCDEQIFQRIAAKVNHVYFDLKIADEAEHLKWTGVSNEIILRNLEWLNESNTEYTIRIPMIPYITDTKENTNGLTRIIQGKCSKSAVIHLLPYNRLVEGKYISYKMDFRLSDWYRNNLTENITEFSQKLSDYGYTVKNYLGDKE